MYSKVAIVTLLLLFAATTIGGYIVGVNQNRNQIQSLRAQIEDLNEQLNYRREGEKSGFRQAVEDFLWFVGKFAPLLAGAVLLSVAAWASVVYVQKERRVYRQNKLGQLPVVEREMEMGKTAIVPLEAPITGVTIGKEVEPILHPDLSPTDLVEIFYALSSTRIAAALGAGSNDKGRKGRVYPANPILLMNAMASQRRPRLPEVRVVTSHSLSDVLTQLEGPNAKEYLPDSLET